MCWFGCISLEINQSGGGIGFKLFPAAAVGFAAGMLASSAAKALDLDEYADAIGGVVTSGVSSFCGVVFADPIGGITGVAVGCGQAAGLNRRVVDAIHAGSGLASAIAGASADG